MVKKIAIILFCYLSVLYGQFNDKVWSISYRQSHDLMFSLPSTINRYANESNRALVGSNVRIHPTTNSTQSEMSIAVSPLNKNVILVSANTSDYPVTTIYGTGVYWSTDGGISWEGYDQPPTGNNNGDPAVAIDRNGYYYVNGIASNQGQGVMRSTDGGISWTYHTISNPNGGILDKNHLTVDNSPKSPYKGNLYAAWTDFGQEYYPIEFARSTDYGKTWVNIQNISANQWGQGVNLQVSSGGTVYAIWAYPQSTWPYTETSFGFNKSTDGGVSWGTPSIAISNIKGIRTTSFSNYGIRANSFPSMAVSQITGTIYVVWTNYGVPGTNTGDPDIYMIKSTDRGASWGTPQRINDDPIGNGANQFFPWITVDPVSDIISVIFYDGRNYIGRKEVQITVAQSNDGGATFTNKVVNDVDFTVAPLPGFVNNYAGDYIGIAARDGVAYPVWHAQVPGVNSQGWVTKLSNAIDVTVDQIFSTGNRVQ